LTISPAFLSPFPYSEKFLFIKQIIDFDVHHIDFSMIPCAYLING